MANQEIVKFISEQKVAGYTDQQIKEALKSKGWADADVDSAFAEWSANPVLPDRQHVGRFIGESWEIYKRLFPQFMNILGKLLLKALIVAIPGIVIGGLGFYLDDSGQISKDTLNSAAVGLGVIYFIVFVYFAIWCQVSFIHLVRNRNMTFTADEHLEKAKPFMGAYFLTSLMAGILTGLWFLLLIIPGIIYAVYYMLAEYIVVDKNIRGMDAIRLSKKYVEGMWWPVFSSMLGLGAVWILVYIVTSIIGYATGPVGQNIASTAINIFFTPYTIIYMYLIYERLKAIKPEVQ